MMSCSNCIFSRAEFTNNQKEKVWFCNLHGGYIAPRLYDSLDEEIEHFEWCQEHFVNKDDLCNEYIKYEK